MRMIAALILLIIALALIAELGALGAVVGNGFEAGCFPYTTDQAQTDRCTEILTTFPW